MSCIKIKIYITSLKVVKFHFPLPQIKEEQRVAEGRRHQGSQTEYSPSSGSPRRYELALPGLLRLTCVYNLMINTVVCGDFCVTKSADQ